LCRLLEEEIGNAGEQPISNKVGLIQIV